MSLSEPLPLFLPHRSNLDFVESIYAEYLRNPSSVSDAWRSYFQDFDQQEAHTRNGAEKGNGLGDRSAVLEPTKRPQGLFGAIGARRDVASSEDLFRVAHLQDKVNQLIRNFRVQGHRLARINPLGVKREVPDELKPENWGFSTEDLETVIQTSTIQCPGPLTVRQIIEKLQSTYCRSIGVQYTFIDDLRIRRWLQQRMEWKENRLSLERDEQLRIFKRLTDAVSFEDFLHKKFTGAKSFSLEGCESLIPLLDMAIEKAGDQGVKEVVLGMAHRGRLNVLANIMGKSLSKIFREFEDADPELYYNRGDVKYHLGHSCDWQTGKGHSVHLSLCFNPSHLEYVNPVALGRVRAKQDRVKDTDRRSTMALLIHGDASFAGEGVVQETLNLSQLEGYSTGGTLHVIVNNQIGFTTPPEQGRSCPYATDVAKMLQIPIFHVNGEDPEAVAQVVDLAMEFRHEFQKDVIIDMYGYRRFGHNESDEPAFTQPVMYKAIAKRPSVREGYLERLLKMNDITREEADAIAEDRRIKMEAELTEAKRTDYHAPAEKLVGIWARSHFLGGAFREVAVSKTGLTQEVLKGLMGKLTALPEEFSPHPKIQRFLAQREAMVRGEQPLDWSAAEALAFGSLLAEGVMVRLSGQDCQRGTFSQRHAVLFDHEDGDAWVSLNAISEDQGTFYVYNSPLSEAGVLGFDYGYSLDCPDGLVLWEAQFGDFVNAAQVIVDQFIAAAEDKWRRLSGLVMLLPHGFEGMGPEHSSARLERFLNLAAEDNMQVVVPTTPAQYFHVIRRQIVSRWRKPLVVFTPKSLLRHPKVVSGWAEFEADGFQMVFGDSMGSPVEEVKRILICTGKVYYELESAREKHTDGRHVSLIRMEQLYPLPLEELEAAIGHYAEGTPVFWVQEEPVNMGAWYYLHARLGEMLLGKFPFSVISRPESASPATGSANSHKFEQKNLIDQALRLA